ncbi:proline-serine-threonine phosphatase-interacting protein 1-like [Dysidea avara]|uniref:proline-serine-threonine phosphatase-interacting protein 1-like n=1 Tax=Dysidea avara TaxID=196820 RepID=UPI00333305E2
MKSFAQNFWGAEFCSNQGFDALVKRLKDGKKMCTDFEEFLEKRAKAEEKYGKELVQLAKQASGREEIGSVRKAWDDLKTETENIGKAHIESSRRILEELDKNMKDFREQQREIRKKAEDTVRRASRHKKTCYDRTMSTKSSYESKCREADKTEESFHKIQNTPASRPPDIQKAQKKMEHSKSTSQTADQTYQDAVKNLEEARVLWEREMELLCNQFQDLEENRIAFLRHTMWTLTNVGSNSCVEIDQMYENVRKSLEQCDVDADIELFVTTKSTGSERPAQILYQNFYHPSLETTVASPSAVPAPSMRNRPLPSEPVELFDSSVGGGGLDQENVYNVPIQRVVALYDYAAQGPEELTLHDGDIITLLAKEDDEWWQGKMNDKTGMFPASYVEELQAP